MSKSISVAPLPVGEYEPTLHIAVLRACAGCRSPHPRALGLDTDSCPQCGLASTGPEQEQVVPALVVGPFRRVLRLLTRLARRN